MSNLSNAEHPAFPTADDWTYCGMTKREYIATMVLQGLAAKYGVSRDGLAELDSVEELALEIADEFLLQLDKVRS